MCRAYARAIVADMGDFLITPIGKAPVSLQHLLYSQIRGATRGLQSEDLVYKLVLGVEDMLQVMGPSQENEHLELISRQVGLRGTDLRFVVRQDGASERDVLIPYPAFRWFWKTALAFKWSSEQHINVLEMTAVLAELRRRARKGSDLFHRYIHIIDSMVCYWALTKGRSSSHRLNRVLRRVMAVEVASGLKPLVAWTLSKWNFADVASRKFEVKSLRPHA
eukprot:Skav234215  [mRNA]  locus=scaffold1101:73234:73896:- [translate_table: standard]